MTCRNSIDRGARGIGVKLRTAVANITAERLTAFYRIASLMKTPKTDRSSISCSGAKEPCKINTCVRRFNYCVTNMTCTEAGLSAALFDFNLPMSLRPPPMGIIVFGIIGVLGIIGISLLRRCLKYYLFSSKN